MDYLGRLTVTRRDRAVQIDVWCSDRSAVAGAGRAELDRQYCHFSLHLISSLI